MFWKAEKIVAYFHNWNLSKKARYYLEFHSKRYEYLIKAIDEIIIKIQAQNTNKAPKILDIGPCFQTEILRSNFPDFPIDTIGYEDNRFKKRKFEKHWEFDLNNVQHTDRWLHIGKYDLIIMAEVIEHLYASPKWVMQYIAESLKKGGYLIIQTPNAISLSRRIKFLRGKPPLFKINYSEKFPGHFREFTAKEIILLGQKYGLISKKCLIHNYFHQRGVKYIIYNAICKLLPNQFRDGITIYFQKSLK